MDAESLKIILELKKKEVMYDRALTDLYLITTGKDIVIPNYNIGGPAQSTIEILAKALKSKQE